MRAMIVAVAHGHAKVWLRRETHEDLGRLGVTAAGRAYELFGCTMPTL